MIRVIYIIENNKISEFNQKRIVSRTAMGEIHLPEKMDLDINANSTNTGRKKLYKEQKLNHTTFGAFNIVIFSQNKS